jgi:hypothetical protein
MLQFGFAWVFSTSFRSDFRRPFEQNLSVTFPIVINERRMVAEDYMSGERRES